MREQALVAGKYRVLRKLGEGGMGSVWLARNEVTEREFAIKFLHPSADRSESQLSRFFQEARVAGKLRHPSIVEIFDAGSEPSLGDAPYLVMELLDGVGLDEAIRRAGALPLGVALEITLESCRALALAHEKGIIHRDLKPSNVFLHKPGSGAVIPKVLDFGISKVLVDEATGRHVTGMTRTGAVLGSPLYMSPEQAAGDKTIDARSDVHALGVLLWECLVGKVPFVAESYGLLLVEIIQTERPELSSVLPSVPPAVSRLMRRAIARDRGERFSNAGEMAGALEHVMEELGHTPVLSARDGAERLVSLLGAGVARDEGPATRTTAAVEVPLAPPPPQPVTAPAATGSPSSASEPSETTAPELPIRRTGRALAFAGIAGVVVVGIAVAWTTRSPTTNSEAPPPGESSAATGALMAAEAPASAAPTVSPVITEPDSAAPLASAVEAAPAAGAPHAGSARTAAPKATIKPKTDRSGLPALAAPKPTASVRDVHHGVTSSGL